MSNMHFPDKYFIVKRIGSEKPLAYLTPDGTDTAAKKRKESALKWAYLFLIKIPINNFANEIKD